MIILIVLFAYSLFAVIFMTVNAMRTILDNWKMIRLLNKEYHVGRYWCIIILTSLSTIIIWVFYWCSVINRLIL